MDYIKEHYDTADDSKKAFYDKIIYCVEKFGFERLARLAFGRRNRIIKKVNFKSLSIAGNSRCEEILVYNENKESSYNAFVKLSWHTREHMILPIRFSSAFYGDIKKYNNKKGNFRYILKVDIETRMVCVILSDIRERKYINANPLYNDIAGVDCNVKNNMFTVYTGKRFLKYDYDRKLMKRYCLLLKKIDKMKKINPNYVMGKSMKRKKAAMERAMLGKEREEMVKMCKELLTYGIHHVVFENLTKSFARTRAKSAEFCGINYNRLMSFLHFSSLKDEFMHIALHYDICVSLVHPHYSSKQCSECGCIDDENRRCQEIFCCTKDASHTLNADENAAINIYKRVKEAVLRNALLQPSTKTHSKGTFEPKPMKAEEIKEILLKFYEV